MTKKRRRFPVQGFTLIEIMIVLTLIGLIMASAAVYVMGRLKAGEVKSARNQAYEIAKALDLYRLDNGRYPTQEEGLQLLVNPAKGEPILKQMPKDPWGHEFLYIYPGDKNKNQPDVRSKGPDGIENTEDDVGNWSED